MSAAVRIGVVDVGTVSARLGIADVEDGELTTFTKKTTICDLGQGLDETGELAPDAIDRVLRAAADYARCLGRNRCDAVLCTLTQAAREASNAEVLLDGLRELGYDPMVIDGEIEGALTALGAQGAEAGPYPIVADNGGGSTELSRWLEDGTLWIRSTPAGCRRVSERFLAGGDPPGEEEIRRARIWCHDTFEETIDWEPGDLTQTGRLVVTGGTATTLAAIVHELETYDAALVHGTVLSRREIDTIAESLGHLTQAERGEVVGIQPKRAPVILGGVLILSELMGVLGYDDLMVSENDSLQGLIQVGAAIRRGEPSPIGWTPRLTRPAV